jgi:hypothetical protein
MNAHGKFIVTRGGEQWCDISGPVVILGDWRFWTDHEAELAEWCRDNGAHWQGMTVRMSEEVLTLFTLRWS